MARSPTAAGIQEASSAARTALFQETVLVHLDAAYSLARYLARRADVAEDLVQEAVLRAFRGFDSCRGENAKAWFLTILRNCFFSRLEKEKLEFSWVDEHLSELIDKASVADGTGQETPESLLMKQDDSRLIRAAIEQLPHPFREVLVLAHIEELSYREIAEITGVPIGTVMSRLSRARQMFANAWKGLDLAPEGERTA
jgi:RNA polymerase sigma-70 factor (ECF subfamily)